MYFNSQKNNHLRLNKQQSNNNIKVSVVTPNTFNTYQSANHNKSTTDNNHFNFIEYIDQQVKYFDASHLPAKQPENLKEDNHFDKTQLFKKNSMQSKNTINSNHTNSNNDEYTINKNL